METVVVPNLDFVKRGVLLGPTTKLGSGSHGILAWGSPSWSLTLLVITIGVVGTLHMVFINLITTTHVNKTVNRPPMSLKDVGRYKSANSVNPKGGYWEPSTITAQFSNHKNGHYVRPNKVTLKYLDF